MQIRTATQADLPAMARVQVETKRAVYLGFYPPELLMQMSVEKTAAAWQKNLFDAPIHPGVFALVAEQDKHAVVGILIGGPEASRSLEGTGEIYVLYILPAFERQGIGRALVQTAARNLLQAGYHRLLIWVLAENPARMFYEALGGKVVDRKEMDLNGYRLQEIGYGWEDLSQLVKNKKVEDRHAEQANS